MKGKSPQYILVILCAAMLLLPISSLAAGSEAAVVEVYTTQDAVELFIQAPYAEAYQMQVQIGKQIVSDVSFDTIRKGESIKTLFLIDNSLSITEEEQEQIADLLQYLIDGKAENEEYAISTFSEGREPTCDYLTDRYELMKAVSSIQYREQNAFLADVLYQTIQEFNKEETCFRRVILIGDGMDDNPNGITQEELFSLLGETPYPIHAIVCGKGENEAGKKNMLALARITQASGNVIEGLEPQTLKESLDEAQKILHATIQPQEQLLDGNIQNVIVTLEFDNMQSIIRKDVRMPFKSVDNLLKESTASEPKCEEQQAGTEEDLTVLDTEQGQGSSAPHDDGLPFPLWGIIIAITLLGAVAVGLTIILKNKKKEIKKAEPLPSFPTESVTDGVTVMCGHDSRDEEVTIGFFGNRYKLILTDIDKPSHKFEVYILDKVGLGRGEANAVNVDYDASVSRKHCEICAKDGKLFVRDLNSTSGTYLNGEKIEEHELKINDILGVGTLDFNVEIDTQ